MTFLRIGTSTCGDRMYPSRVMLSDKEGKGTKFAARIADDTTQADPGRFDPARQGEPFKGMVSELRLIER
jgi:hypothetical protein